MDTPIEFQINTGSAEPIYRQLMDQLRRRVSAGQWRARKGRQPGAWRWSG